MGAYICMIVVAPIWVRSLTVFILSDIGLYHIKDLCADLLSRIATPSLWMDSFRNTESGCRLDVVLLSHTSGSLIYLLSPNPCGLVHVKGVPSFPLG